MELSQVPQISAVFVDPDETWIQVDDVSRLRAQQIARGMDCDPLVIQRLTTLGATCQEAHDYLNPSTQDIVHPYDTIKDQEMKHAASALTEGIAQGDKVAIFGDYDVDGQSALAIVVAALTSIGAEVIIGQATAATGFGLSRDFVEQASGENAKWLITVDCGSTQTQPVMLAQSLGMKVIIVDHHDVDIENPADFFLNPRYAAALASNDICQWVAGTACRQKLAFDALTPTEVVDKLTANSKAILQDEISTFGQACRDIRQFDEPANTGSMLAWKFGAAILLTQTARVPGWFYGQPLYLAGLGAIADMAPCDDKEVRAFVRLSTDRQAQRRLFGNRRSIPVGVELLAETLGEDASRPDLLMRTRALCNLPKRTTDIDATDIQQILTGTDYSQLAALVPGLVETYERVSGIRRDQMDTIAIEQAASAAVAASTGAVDTRFVFAVLDGFEAYAGYTRMVANTLTRMTTKPAIAFACKGEDEFGQILYKWSGANDVVPDAPLGELIHFAQLREACKIQMRNWMGEPDFIENIGGHTAVVSGVCTQENIQAVKDAVEAWAAGKAAKSKWRTVGERRPRVAARQIDGARFRRLEREADMLAPIAFPTSPSLIVSAVVTFDELQYNETLGSYHCDFVFDDGERRHAVIGQRALACLQENGLDEPYEVVFALGSSTYGDYFIGDLAKVHIPVQIALAA